MSDLGIDISYLVKDEKKEEEGGIKLGTINMSDKPPAEVIEDAPKKKKRESKSPDVNAMASNAASVETQNYADSYNETNNIIRGAIIQADVLSGEIKQDIDAVRSSKTIKNKYTYITNLTASASALINTKIAAVKELNSSITQSHRFNLDRLKMFNNENKDGNDDARTMDLYNMYLTGPMAGYIPNTPSVQDINLGVNGSSTGNIQGVDMGVNNNGGQPLTPEQKRMRFESNPDIKVVVKFDQASGKRFFDVIDGSGKSIPDYPRPDDFLLEDTTIDVAAGVAKNRNINQIWPLIIIGSGNINEY